MLHDKKKILITVLFAVLFTGHAVSVGAYVLNGHHLIDLMTKKLKGAKTLLVTQKLTIFDTSDPKKAARFDETLRYVFPETFRSDIRSESAQRIKIVSKGEILTVIDGKISSRTETRFDRYKDILLYHSRKLLQNHLDRLGLDSSVSSLGRFEGKVVFVLGSEYPDESRPQIWIEKDTFMPVRWVIDAKTADRPEDFLEVRYLRWRHIDKAWYPMHIEFYQNHKLERDIRVETVQVNPVFMENLFDINQLILTYRPKTEIPPDQPKQSEINEVQKTIKDFKMIYD
ncbi:hypothetical protein ACFLZM_01175 [Thermodesulfobacteriota bacterium]